MNRSGFVKLIITSMIVLLLTGCDLKKEESYKLDPENPTSIEIWHYYNGQQKMAFDKLVKEFNDTVGAEKGIIVEAFSQGNVVDLSEKVLDSANKKVGSEEVPNVFAAYSDTAYEMDKLELLVDISKYISKDELNEYIEEYVDEGRLNSDNKFKLFPIAKSTEILMLNKTDWDKFAKATNSNINDIQTIEGLVETSKKYYEWTDSLTKEPNDGKAFFGRDAIANYIIIGSKQLGVEIFSVKDGKVTLNLDEKVMKKLWDNFYVPYINGYFASYGKFRSDDAKTGDILALVGSSSGASYFPGEVMLNDNESYKIETSVFQAPRFKDKEKYAVQQGAGMAVTKSTKEEEYASVEFLKWFTDKESNIKFSIASGYLPVKKKTNDLNVIKDVMNKDDLKVSSKVESSIISSIEQINSCKLYTNKAFDGGTKARQILEYSMIDKAKEDLKKINELIKNGTSKENAVAQFNNDENFSEWFLNFKTELENAVKE
ncbi:extracellular solute-binding protein [Clostridioides sp. ZZV14-5902]|uniref:extracellular solute-binding protein n=1 Tax=Clostridioides sp. ZZV14-5902 TaxID=2811486 RepID=UPI001D121DC7|nr:extracellular solute-binding protein [Clostridioides sp. ZZV14-5902]